MFSFLKSSSHHDFSAIGTDMHSHLVPGVDDGAPDVNASIELINGLQNLGFHTLFTTPHSLADIHPNSVESLTTAFKTLEPSIPENVTVKLSSEYYMDEQFASNLAADKLVPLPNKRILIECSQILRPLDLEEVIFDIGLKGYFPILAHPERYLFLHNDFSSYEKLKDTGLEFQLNAMSLTGHYGKHIKVIAEKLIDKGMIDYIGTDIHHSKHLEVLKRVPGKKHFARLLDSGLLRNHTLLES